MEDSTGPILNERDAPVEELLFGEHWGARFKALTVFMKERGGKLGVNLMRVPPGRTAVPFHAHLREDEVFYVLSGSGKFRYGDEIFDIGPGDCISCPAGTQTAHQIANTGDEELVYLAIGTHDPHEVCTYPDNGKVLVRGIKQIGRLTEAPYLDGEPERPRIFDLATSE